MDYLAAIGDRSGRLVGALDVDRTAPVRSCGTWTVQDCAHHVGSLHHVLSRVVAGRPTTDFGAFGDLRAPDPSDDGLGAWVAEGTARLLSELASAAPTEPCWTFSRDRRTVGFWSRRAAHETAVHCWDVEDAVGRPSPPSEPVLAADGVDEYLDLMVTRGRRGRRAPASAATVHLHAHEADGEWLLSFPSPGETVLARAHAKGDMALRGSAEALLLFLWGRRSPDEAGVEVLGDRAVLDRWPALVPAV